MFLLISCFCVVKVVAVIASTSTSDTTMTSAPPSALPLSAAQKDSEIGTFPPISAWPNEVARSLSRKPCGLFFFAAWSSRRNSAKKIGIWRISGKQDANGFVPASRYSFIVSSPRRCRSWPYFFCSSFTLGCSSCMLRCDLICFTNSGISRIRITMVRPTIDSAHAQPPSLSRNKLKKLWNASMIAEIA